MEALFSQVLNMSLTGSVVILFVLAARLALKGAPKIFSYALWAVVLFRLLCPVSVPAPVSVLEVANPEITQSEGITSSVTYIPAVYIPAGPTEDLPEQMAQATQQEQEELLSTASVVGIIWLVGLSVMLLRSLVEYLQLYHRLIGAACIRENIYLADHIGSPFVMGILCPKIYLPSGIPSQERHYIVAHERHHIRRGDHIVKLFAYAALSIHWFNPLVWIAFVQAGKDMEMSCDEAVIKKLGPQIRADYSASLLRLATGRRIIGGTPLAFGEGDTKGRIRNMAKWKKPKLWVSLVSILLCIAVLAACAVNPQDKEATTALEKKTNILIVGLDPAKETPKGDSMLLLTLDPQENTAAIYSFLNTTVKMPDYQGHVSGDHPFSVCYSLGFAFGNGTAGAMEYSNLCLKKNYDIDVDYNAAISTEELAALIDTLGGITVEITAEDTVDFDTSELAQLRDSQPGPLKLDGNTAAAYAAVLKNGETAEEELRRTNRQRKLFSALIPALGVQQPEKHLPALYASDALDGEPADWTDILKQLRNTKTLSLGTIPAEFPTEPGTKSPVTAGSEVETSIEVVQYGDLTMALPEGYTSREEAGKVILSKDSIDVAGITSWTMPKVPLGQEDILAWYRALGLPEAQESEEPIAYMGGNSPYGDIEAEFFNELSPEKLNVEHHFFLDGAVVYDVYFDQNVLTDGQASHFLKTIALHQEPVVPEDPDEETARMKCRNILNLVQAGSHAIASERENTGTIFLNGTSSSRYYQNNGNWLSITEIPEAGGPSIHGYMEMDGIHYNNEGNAWDEAGRPYWEERKPVEVRRPWLSTFQWDDAVVSYMDTIVSGGEECIMLRIDEPYFFGEDNGKFYFVNFYIAGENSFLRAELQVNLFMDNEFTEKESIITLDEVTVEAAIKAEYERAQQVQ